MHGHDMQLNTILFECLVGIYARNEVDKIFRTAPETDSKAKKTKKETYGIFADPF
jgi:hypothetical protein